DDPVGPGPAIAILSGNFATSAVVRLGIRDGSRPEEFTGPARVFESSMDCLQGIEDGVVCPGDVVIARNQGLKGGPAMGGSASLVLFALDAAGLAKSTAFVTDGQLSGLCLKGLTVAEVSPEAATGGPIGKVRDGDMVTISVAGRGISVALTELELAQRNGPGMVVPASGYLDTFRKTVRGLETGGVLLPERG
ncbi:MAG: dihydroxy-acid dehydratase, partial [Alteraurantiacibacter sp.]